MLLEEAELYDHADSVGHSKCIGTPNPTLLSSSPLE